MTEYEYETYAMGTDISVSIISDSETDAIAGRDATFQTITKYENCFSRFRSESELSRLNETKKAVVSPLFYKILEEALLAHTLSKGTFNPLVQIARLGYNQNFEDLSNDQKMTMDEPYNTDVSVIEIHSNTHTVILKEGQKLDFGGFLKGYLAEKIAHSLMKTFPSYRGVIVNLGGDLHTRGLDADNSTFMFDIFNPVTKTDIPIEIQDKSLSTSGTYKRTWGTEAGLMHHILDKTGTTNPKTDIVSASIIHPNGAKSEVYAKVFIGLQLEDALRIVNDSQVSYILITNTGEILKNI